MFKVLLIPTLKRFLKIEQTEEDTPGADIGKIGYIAVSAVKHNGSGTITIKTKRETLTLRGSVEKPLLIVFSNACLQDDCPSTESDFPLYYKAFKIKSTEKKFRLEAVPETDEKPELAKLSFFYDLFEKEPLRSLLSNNDAPCGAAGYGRSDGLSDSGSGG